MGSSTVHTARAALHPRRRLFAGLGFVTLVAVCIATITYVSLKRPTPVALLHGLFVLPSVLWGGHRLWHAAKGTTPMHAHWPFATQGVATGYFLIAIAISLFASRLYQ